MKFDFSVAGGSMLAAAPMLMQLTGSATAWWVGFGFLVAGPLMLGIRRR